MCGTHRRQSEILIALHKCRASPVTPPGGSLFGHDGAQQGFPHFVANLRTARLSRSRGANWPSGVALMRDAAFA